MRFFNTLERIRLAPPSFGDPFVTQWEIPEPRDQQDRKYIVFDGVEEYEKCFSQRRYYTCHEVFMPQSFALDGEVEGHPAFDFDKKRDENTPAWMTKDNLLPSDWRDQIQNAITTILCRQYPTNSQEIFTSLQDPNNWVWMTSPSSEKISAHLTIKSITFTTWRQQMKILIHELQQYKEDGFDPIILSAIDNGIYRKAGSLRLPLNSKKPKKEEYTDEQGNTHTRLITSHLMFDNPDHRFRDGLVLIHEANIYTLKDGVILTVSELAPEYHEQCTYVPPSLMSMDSHTYESVGDENLMINALNLLNKFYDTGLDAGIMNGSLLPLHRKYEGTCPISRRMHESDNGFLFMKGGKVFFSCHRGCTVTINNEVKKAIDVTPYSKNDNEIALACLNDIEKHTHQ